MTNDSLELSVMALLKAQAETGTGLTAYHDLIPADTGQESVFPAVRFSTLDSHEVKSAAAPTQTVLWHFDMLWVVTFKSDSITDAMVTTISALRAALDGYAVNSPTLNCSIYSCRSMQPFRQTESVSDGFYRTFGNEYHVVAKEAD